MARIVSCGFELNSLVVSDELIAVSAGVGTNLTIDSTIKRTGSYSLKININTNSTRGVSFTGLVGNVAFARVYFYLSSTPNADTRIVSIGNQTGASACGMKLTTTGALQLYDEDGDIGSATSALNTGQWYCLELKMDVSAAAGSHVVDGRLDGSSFASASNRSIGGTHSDFAVGSNLGTGTNTSGVWYFDDAAVNDNSGSTQNSWCGTGNIIYLFPNAAGDNSAWTASAGSNYQCVDDITPNDATDYVSSNTANQIDDYNLTNTAFSGSVTLVELHSKARDNGSAASRNVLRVKASSGGTVEESSAINNTAAFAQGHLARLILYDLPGASTTAWTTTDLDAAQMGIRLSSAGTANTDLTAEWLIVEYIQAYSLSVDAGTYTETGTAATLKAGRKLSVSAGSYTWTGTDATLTYTPVSGGYTLTVDPGAYTLSGTAANLYYGRKLSVDSGSYTLSGTDVSFLRGYALSASSGVYTISGTAADLLWAHILTATDGTYLITGSDATLARLFTLAADPGAYTITGTAADLLKALLLSLGEGAYTITGTNAVLVKNIPLSADAGSFVITGTDATFPRTYLVTAVPGQYVITGTAADLVPWFFPLPDPGEWLAIAPYVATRSTSYSDSTRGTATDQTSLCYSSRVTDVAMYNRTVSANSYNDSTRGVSNRNPITTGFSV